MRTELFKSAHLADSSARCAFSSTNGANCTAIVLTKRLGQNIGEERYLGNEFDTGSAGANLCKCFRLRPRCSFRSADRRDEQVDG